jgi:hypothetical protein
MEDKSDRIAPLLFGRLLTPQELAYWEKVEPEMFCDHHSPVNVDPDWDADDEDAEED